MQKYAIEIQKLQKLIQDMYDASDAAKTRYDPEDPISLANHVSATAYFNSCKNAVISGYDQLESNKNLQMYLKLADSEFLDLYKRLQMHMRLMNILKKQ